MHETALHRSASEEGAQASLMFFETRGALARAVAAGVYLASVALFVLVQEIGLWLRREERRAWWAGTGRDVLNAVGVAAVTASLRAYGFPLPSALGLGATLTLALFGTSLYMETRAGVARRRLWALVVAFVLASPLLLFPREILALFARISALLFPYWD